MVAGRVSTTATTLDDSTIVEPHVAVTGGFVPPPPPIRYTQYFTYCREDDWSWQGQRVVVRSYSELGCPGDGDDDDRRRRMSHEGSCSSDCYSNTCDYWVGNAGYYW